MRIQKRGKGDDGHDGGGTTFKAREVPNFDEKLASVDNALKKSNKVEEELLRARKREAERRRTYDHCTC